MELPGGKQDVVHICEGYGHPAGKHSIERAVKKGNQSNGAKPEEDVLGYHIRTKLPNRDCPSECEMG